MLDESVSQLVHELCHKTQKFPFPVFIDFVRKSVNLAFLQENGIAYVKKEENPPSAPQISPIKNYWGILKMKVYERNWTAKNRESLIRRIKLKQKEIDQDIAIKMFDNLKGKVHTANETGLNSLLKI